jgi:hypothetical protein
MSVLVTVPARLYGLPDDVLRALATFVPLSDLLVLVRCSRHFRVVLQRQLNRCLDGLFVVTHLEEHILQARCLSLKGIPYQPEQRVLNALFGEPAKKADVRGDSSLYCFVEVDGQSILCFTQRTYATNIFAAYIVFGKTQSSRDRFASWLRYRCEQHLATEAHSNILDVDTSDI